MTYEQTRKDFEYLEALAELSDQVELDTQRLDLMREPTKKRAASLYKDGIHLWFAEHQGRFDDERVREISYRYIGMYRS